MPSYKGFNIDATVSKSVSGGYGASVMVSALESKMRVSKFELPLDEDMADESEALNEAIQYGRDLVDGLLPWFDPQSMSGS